MTRAKLTPATPADHLSGDAHDGVQTVESVRRALRILRCFSSETPEIGVTEAARALNMHKSTIHRLMVTMEREGFIHQVEGGRYALSWTIFEIATGVAAWQGIHETVLATLHELAQRTGETAHLAVLDDGDVLYVEKVEGTWSLRMPSAVGRRVPLHCTALGKTLLAGLDPAAARRIIYGRTWERLTRHTVTDPEALDREIVTVRERGYAIDREEIEEGLLCVAAPVVDDKGVTCAGVSIAAPASRAEQHLDENITAVKRACRDLSKKLGPRARRLQEASEVVRT